MTGGCAEIATGCCCFGQRSAQSSRATRLVSINPVSVDTAHKETSDPTAATAQTSCVRSDLQQTKSGRCKASISNENSLFRFSNSHNNSKSTISICK